jgi:hypothetical protein
MAMIEAGMTQASEPPVEDVLRDELAHGDVVLDTIGPILGHLLANHDHSLFSDEIVSRVRGMIADLARQLLEAQANDQTETEPQEFAGRHAERLAEALTAAPEIRGHCHALALEWQLAIRLEARSGIDPVLSPLIQALVASDDTATASAAMALLAAQARFMQRQRRMELPLSELPADLFHLALTSWREHAGDEDGTAIDRAEARLRADYDESASRIGLLSRLVMAMGGGARAALSVSHAGVALFLSTLAIASNQQRDLAVISTNDRQLARLALALRTAGLKPKEVEEQFAYLHPEVSLPGGFETLRADRAAAMLSEAGRWSAV